MPDNNYQFINLDYLETISGGDRVTQQTILKILCDDLETLFAQLQPLAVQGAWQSIAEVAHKLKSSLAFAGNDVLTTCNNELLENTRLAKNLDKVPDLIQKMEKQTPLVLQELYIELAQ
ncbi:MAG: Hpt domain-containing protein [Saprospiraceae bacterium]